MLGELGRREAIPNLLKVLDDPDREVRVSVIMSLGRILVPVRGVSDVAEIPPEVVAALIRRAKEDHYQAARLMAIDALGVLAPGSQEAQAFVLRRLDDLEEDPEVRSMAFISMAGWWQVSDEGMRYCSDPSPGVRQAAMDSLRRFRDEQYPEFGGEALSASLYCDAVIRGLADPNMQIRLIAAILPARRGQVMAGPWRRAFPAIIAAIADPEPMVRSRAYFRAQMMPMGTEHAPLLIWMLARRLMDGAVGEDDIEIAPFLQGLGWAIAADTPLFMKFGEAFSEPLPIGVRGERIAQGVASWLASRSPAP